MRCSLHSPLAECYIYLTLCTQQVFQLSRCLFEQETKTNPLWVPQQGLAFVRSNDVIYGGPVSILFMCTLDLLGSAEGVTGRTQQTTVWGWNLELRWKRALVSLVAAFVEVGHVLILLCSGGLAHYVTVVDWLYTTIHNFSQHLFSKWRVLCFTVVFVVILSAAYWYILHKFTGDL
jgi:hypothetical protein